MDVATVAALLLAALIGLRCDWLGGTQSDDHRSPVEFISVGDDIEYVTTPIKELRPGDYVLAISSETGEVEEKPTVDVMVRTAHELWILTMADAEGDLQVFQTTDEHPFWVKSVALATDLRLKETQWDDTQAGIRLGTQGNT